MGKKRSRSRSRSGEENLRKRIKKLEKIIKEKTRTRSPESTPPPSTSSQVKEIEVEDTTGDDMPEELLSALGKEGEDIKTIGEDIQPELAKRWTNIMRKGLGKEERDIILKKYLKPGNFPAAIPPILNEEIAASLSAITIKRDKRIIFQQMFLGKLLTALGVTLTNVLKGHINSREIVEKINDSAKIAAELYYQDSASRKYFALTGTPTAIKQAVKKGSTEEYLFGKNCLEHIKSAQAIQKTGSQIKDKQRPRENWKSPLQQQPHYRSGPPYQSKTRNNQPGQRTQSARRTQTQGAQTARRRPVQLPSKPVQSRYRR